MIRKYLKKLVVTYPKFLEHIKWLLSFKIISHNRFYKHFTLRKALNQTTCFHNSDLIVCIENTASCNARCVICLHNHTEITGSMPMPLYEKLINECVENKIKRVSFGVYGEPLADQLFIDRIQHLRSRGLEYMIISNGSLLSDELARRLFQLGGLKEIRFSVNGFSKKMCEKVMIGLDRDTTYENILNFLKLKKLHNKADLTVNISCVKTKYIVKELDELINFWEAQEGIGRIYLLDLIDKFGNLTNTDGIGRRGILDRDDLWFPPCNELWSYLTVYYNGKVAPCCMDNNERILIVGDVNNQSLGEILTGEPYNALRKTHLENQRNKHFICKKCHYPSYWY